MYQSGSIKFHFKYLDLNPTLKSKSPVSVILRENFLLRVGFSSCETSLFKRKLTYLSYSLSEATQKIKSAQVSNRLDYIVSRDEKQTLSLVVTSLNSQLILNFEVMV